MLLILNPTTDWSAQPFQPSENKVKPTDSSLAETVASISRGSGGQ